MPGEILYYPMDTWHQIITITNRSISVTGTLVDKRCYKEVAQELDKKCKQAGGGYSPATCDRVRRVCEPWWHTVFGGGAIEAPPHKDHNLTPEAQAVEHLAAGVGVHVTTSSVSTSTNTGASGSGCTIDAGSSGTPEHRQCFKHAAQLE